MVVDVITFNGEFDLFELRYQILKDYVDEFIVIEFDKTFSGKDKPNYELESADVFYDRISHWPKVKYFSIEEAQWSKYLELAKSSSNTEYGKGAEHWIREFCQKESIKDCLTHLKDDDLVFIGDCDEIWRFSLDNLPDKIYKLRLKVYTYWLNNRSSESFAGTIVGKYKWIKDEILNELRSGTKWTSNFHGWHFTSLKDGLKRKLEDSYTSESYTTDAVMNNLDSNIANNKDFLGRDFKYWIDESDWPQYLKENRVKYQHLLK